MRTILYKSGFLRYFSSLIEYCQQGKRKRGYFGVFACFVFFAYFLNQNDWTWGGAIMLALIVFHLGGLRASKPNVVTLAPLSWKQKMIYSWLAPALYFVLAVAAMVIIRVFFLCIYSTYGLLIGGDVTPLWQFAFEFNPYNTMGTYGILFGLIFQLACYSAAMFATYIKKSGFKALFVFLFCLAIYLCLQFMSLPCSLTLEKGLRFLGFFMGTPFYYTCYGYMQYP